MTLKEPKQKHASEVYKYAQGENDRIIIVKSFLGSNGLVNEHIVSFNEFTTKEIKNLVRINSSVVSKANPNIYIKFKDVRVGKPVSKEIDSTDIVTLNECRLKNMTYSAHIEVEVESVLLNKDKGNKPEMRNQWLDIGRIPVMLKSANCHLHEKDEEDIIKMMECPLDPGGYFIIKGTEKVLLIHEQMSKNRMIVEFDKKHRLSCSVTSVTVERKSKTNISLVSEFNLVLVHNIFSEEIPICVAFKAMGIEDDLTVKELIGDSPLSLSVLSCCFKAARKLKIHNQEQAIDYLWNKLAKKLFVGNIKDNAQTMKIKMREHILEIFRGTILCHIPVENWNFRNKAIYMGLMAKRVINAKGRNMTDLDFLGNKRFELDGQLLSLLFEDVFKNFLSTLQACLDGTKAHDLMYWFSRQQEITSSAFEQALSSGKWDIKRFGMSRQSVTQTLARLNYLSTLSHMTKIQSQFEKSRKVGGVRSIHASQYSYMCPFDTPEGEQCGLVKNFALLAHFTTETPEKPVIEILMNLGVTSMDEVDYETISSYAVYKVFINGVITGLTEEPNKLCRTFRALRRMKRINKNVSIGVDNDNFYVLVSTDGGRICRPFIIVENGKSLLQESCLEELRNKQRDFQSLVDEGMIEYLDPIEVNDCQVALNEAKINEEHTHLEIEPFTMFGICCGIIPYPNHTQAPRLTYQCAMGKQAMGVIGYNAAERIDKLRYHLWYPQKPLVATDQAEILHFNELPSGQNPVVAIMSYSGFDIEDAIVINRASLEKGFGRISLHRSHMLEIKAMDYMSGAEGMNGPLIDAITGMKDKFHRALDSDGICAVGKSVDEHDVLINRYTSDKKAEGGNTTKNEMAIKYPWHGASIVNKVMVTLTDKGLIIKVDARQMRSAEVGDKFSSRYGQKGVIGLVLPQEDMPTTLDGITPDLIMNPHGFPSRMTVGKLFECAGAKKFAVSGERTDGTAFMYNPQEEIESVLQNHGYSPDGKDYFIHGITGEVIEGAIFNGPIFYQRLKHMVQDKIHARSEGKKAFLTRQPTEGRSKEGGLRMGEMERDCLLAYGASALIQERFMTSSDGTEVDVCKECGLIGYSGWCKRCSSKANMRKVKMPYATKLLLQEVMAMSIAARLRID